jgi:hypothetical protein
MQMSEAAEVVQVAGATSANEKLVEGWTLLAVCWASPSRALKRKVCRNKRLDIYRRWARCP